MFDKFKLHQELLRALEKLGIDTPTPVQSKAIPVAMQHKDLLVSAETGSGKTLAFVLPMLHRLLVSTDTQTGTRALILVPTRELARQIFQQSLAVASYTQLTAGLIIGGESFSKQKALLRKNPEIIIATPGRMLEHLQRGTPCFDDLEMLILDEADRMLDMGFSEDVLAIAAACNGERQTLLFSATLNHKGVKQVASSVTTDAQLIALNTIKDKPANIQQQIILADNTGHKGQLLRWILSNEKFAQALVFLNSKLTTSQLYEELAERGVSVGLLNGDMDQFQRNRVMQRMHSKEIKVLIATEVAARGLDVRDIDLVINFDMARNGKDYVHRIGRTGRAGRNGLAISLIESREWNLMIGIERFLGQKFERRQIAELEGHYKGPKKLKKSGKAVGPKKKNKTANRGAKSPGKRPTKKPGRVGSAKSGSVWAPIRKIKIKWV